MATIEQYLDRNLTDLSGGIIEEMGDALRAVAQRHYRWVLPDYPDDCHECVEIEGGAPLTWPCPTLRDIHDALGIDGKDETE